MHYKTNKTERGASLLEFAIAATVFLTTLFGVLECGRLLWTHNALKDAVRQGTRYATVRRKDAAGKLAVQKMVVYGDPNANPATATPVASGLTTAAVNVDYNDPDPNNGIQLGDRATVSITGYQFRFAVPLVGGTINMPDYRTSMPGEALGFVPCDNPSAGASLAACTNIIPN
ncbi:MAG: pilus assembly protein [Pyrinomonadaceae bacterium]|nr:pilus assembly protein [Pyrinomonadaceae bacterium]